MSVAPTFTVINRITLDTLKKFVLPFMAFCKRLHVVSACACRVGNLSSTIFRREVALAGVPSSVLIWCSVTNRCKTLFSFQFIFSFKLLNFKLYRIRKR